MLKNYVIYSIKQSKRDKEIFNWWDQAEDEIVQIEQYIKTELGDEYKSEEKYPPKRQKVACPEECGNTYVRITDTYQSSGDKKLFKATCAVCDAIFLICASLNTGKDGCGK